MADYISRLKADTSQHDKALEDSAKKVSNYKKETDQASASVQKMTQQTSRSTSELMKEMSSMENLGRSTSNYKRQLSSLQRQIADLTVNYRQMSDEQRNGAFGQEVAGKIEELKNKAAQYKDAIADVNAEIQHMASDTATWDAAKQGINLVSSAMQTFISVTGLSEKESAKLLQVMNKVKLAEQAANTAINIGNALQKQSALMQGIKALQTKAATAATNAQTVATGKATVAQAAFNAVAKANPYVLLAGAVISVVGAIALFTKGTDKDTEAQKKHNEEIQKAKEKFDNYAKSVGDAGGKLMAKYALLSAEYKKLSSDHQKLQWIKNNKTAFEDLGISVNSLSDAENIFVKNTDAVVEAIKKRAIAAAKQNQLTELSARLMEEQTRAEATFASRQVKAGDKVGGVSHNSATGNEFVDRSGNWVYTVKGAEEANRRIRKEVYSTVTQLQNEIDTLAKDIAGSIDVSSLFTSTKGGDGEPKPPYEEGSLGELRAKLSKEETKLINVKLNDEDLATTQKNIAGLKEQIEAEEIRLGIKVKEDEVAKSLAKAVDGAKKVLESGSKETTAIIEPVKMFDSTLQTAEDTFRDNNDLLKNYNSTLQQLAGSLASLKAAQEALNQAGGPDQSAWTDDARKAYADLKAKIAELTTQYQETIKKAGELTVVQQGLNAEIAKQNEIVAKNDIYGGIKNAWSATKGWADSLVDITEKWEEMSSGEQFTAIVESIFSTIDAFKSLSETISLIDKAFKILGITEQALAAVSTTTTAQEVANEETKQSKDITGISLKIFKSGINAVEGGTSTGFPAMLVAIPVALAAVVAAIASAKSLKGSFAEGGIISGPTSLGDYNIARVNSGEMILNGSQQSRLFNMIKNGGVSGGRIETTTKTKIEGSDLLLISKNYMKKMDKI